jgi:hypothetical protein
MNKQMTKSGFCIAMITLLFFVSCSKNDVTSLTLNKTTSSFTTGQKDTLIAKAAGDGDLSKFPVSWTSSNPGVATVSNGVIQGISKGTVTITAKAGNISANCIVTVNFGINPVITKGFLNYFGDTLHTKVSNLFKIGFIGKVDTLYLWIDLPLTTKNNLPAGDYKFLQWTNVNGWSDFIPNMLLPGGLYSNNNYSYSWYFGSSLKSPIVDGDLTVTLTNSVYTYKFNLIDYFGNVIFGTYQGTLLFSDWTKPQSAPTAKTNRLELRKLNLSSSKLNFIKGK